MAETLHILILLYIRRKVQYFEFEAFLRNVVWTNLWAFCNSGIGAFSFFMWTAVFEFAVTVITSSRLPNAQWGRGFYIVVPGGQELNNSWFSHFGVWQ